MTSARETGTNQQRGSKIAARLERQPSAARPCQSRRPARKPTARKSPERPPQLGSSRVAGIAAWGGPVRPQSARAGRDRSTRCRNPHRWVLQPGLHTPGPSEPSGEHPPAPHGLRTYTHPRSSGNRSAAAIHPMVPQRRRPGKLLSGSRRFWKLMLLVRAPVGVATKA